MEHTRLFRIGRDRPSRAGLLGLQIAGPILVRIQIGLDILSLSSTQSNDDPIHLKCGLGGARCSLAQYTPLSPT